MREILIIVLLMYVLSYRSNETAQFIMPNTVQECLEYLELPSVTECMSVTELTPEARSLYDQSLFFVREHVALLGFVSLFISRLELLGVTPPSQSLLVIPTQLTSRSLFINMPKDVRVLNSLCHRFVSILDII